MANTYKALSTVTVGAGGVASVSFTNIPQTYTDLVVKISVRYSADAAAGYLTSINGNTTFSTRRFYGNTVNSNATSNTGTNFWIITNQSTDTANVFAINELYIPNYASNGVTKTISNSWNQEDNTADMALGYLGSVNATTDPITSLVIQADSTYLFVEHSTFTLYGVFNADVSSAPATPTIGTASVASGTSASITFTPVSNAASYTMTSTPSSITATGTTSPITVSGLTQGTAYTFKVKSNNPFGSSAESAASNSITPEAFAFDSIATTAIGAGGASSVTFSGIPSTYTHLQIRLLARTNRTGYSNDLLKITFNSDTGTNYSAHRLYGDGGSTGSGNNTTQAYIEDWIVSTDTAASNLFGFLVIDIVDYKDTNKFKTLRSLGGFDNNGDGYVALSSGGWRSTSAITSVSITMNSGTSFKQYSHFALYGIKGA